jgi:predicted membrane-bound spermidine synthase
MRAVALLLTVATGFAGLVYEVAWQKYLAVLLGAQSEATAAILAIFLGGLSVGYALFGRVSRRFAADETRVRTRRLLTAYAAVEAAIGVWALAFPWLFRAAQAATGVVPIASPGLGLAFDALLAVLLIGPPTVLMGATIPFLTQALARDLDDATRVHALVYGTNTAGAFAGAAAAGLWLIEALGLVGVLQAMAALNLAAAAGFAAVGRLAPAGGVVSPAQGAASPPGMALFVAVALLLGFAMSTLQTALVRIAGLALGSSHVTFSLVVSTFVLAIALGSFAVSAFARIPSALLAWNLWLLAACFALLHVAMPDTGYWTHVLRSLFRDDVHALWLFRSVLFAALLLVIGVPVVLSGATLPLLFHHLRRTAGDLGAIAGRLYSWNTVGSVLGAVVGGYALFFWLDLDGVFRTAVAALALAAALTSMRVGRRPWAGAVALVPAVGLLLALPAWPPYRLSLGTFRFRTPQAHSFDGPDAYYGDREQRTGERILFYDDDPIASVAVREFPYRDARSRAILTNGKSDGALVGDYPTMALAAALPALLADRAERALVIGWGTGVTAGELAALDSMREVTVAEISPGVIEAAPFFEHGNLGASGNPKVRIVRADAYRALLRSEGQYDVIVSEPSNPWVAGVEMLFSREFLEAARDRLTPGGVYTQWFPTYETDDETVGLVLRTVHSVFGDSAVWYATGPDLLLLGFRGGAPGGELDRLLERAARPDFGALLGRAGVTSAPALLAHELLPRGVVAALDLDGPLHTLLHPRLAARSARAFFAGLEGRLPRAVALDAARVGEERSLLRQLRARPVFATQTVADRQASIREACRYRAKECAVLLAQWLAEEPSNPLSAREAEYVNRHPPPGGPLDPHLVANLVYLFRETAPEPEPGTELASAEQATELFADYYLPAAPFRREPLAALWSYCERSRDVADACRRGRAAAESRLGPLAPAPTAAASLASESGAREAQQ